MNRNERIDADAKVRAVATEFGIRSSRSLETAICAKAEEKVARWIQELGIEGSCELSDMHALVRNRAGIKILRVANDDEMRLAEKELKRDASVLPVQLELEFGGDTEALVVRRNENKSGSRSKYIAVVDARGTRSNRAWFGEQHETVHVVIPDPEASMLLRRTRAERPEPLEQVIDAVASRIGFWAPIVKPVLDANVLRASALVDALETTRQEVAPDSSLEAAYRAFLRMIDRPILLIRAQHGCRRGSEGSLADMMSSYALRAVDVVGNDAARAAGLTLWPNYRIPDDTPIAEAVRLEGTALVKGEDDLGRWPSATGRRLPARRVVITARGGWAVLEPAA